MLYLQKNSQYCIEYLPIIINLTFTYIDDSGTLRKRSKAMETMEILLIDWIKRSNEKIDLKKVKEKALELYYDIKENQKDKTEQELKETFIASNGWFQKFKQRTGLDRNQIDFEVHDEYVNDDEAYLKSET